MKTLFFIIASSLLLFSCNSNERKATKFFKRINAKEINSASKYIWPEDLKKLYVFNKVFLEDNQLINFELEEANEIDLNGESYLDLKINCLNFSPALSNYFDSLGIKKGDYIYDRVKIRKANDIEYITFNWSLANIPSNVALAEITAEELNLRAGPGENFEVVSSLKKYNQILIDENYINDSWNKGITFNENKNPKAVYFSKKYSEHKDISFFTLDYFGQLSGVLICLVALICFIVVYPILIVGAFRTGGEAPKAALILFLMIIGSLYFTYQLLENALFELFLINLPG